MAEKAEHPSTQLASRAARLNFFFDNLRLFRCLKKNFCTIVRTVRRSSFFFKSETGGTWSKMAVDTSLELPVFSILRAPFSKYQIVLRYADTVVSVDQKRNGKTGSVTGKNRMRNGKTGSVTGKNRKRNGKNGCVMEKDRKWKKYAQWNFFAEKITVFVRN